MINEIAHIFNMNYNKIDFTLPVPDCFDYLQSTDANFETSMSNTLQPLKLKYENNLVTDKTAVVFVNPAKSYWSKERESVLKSEQIKKG